MEEKKGVLCGYEIKWRKDKSKPPKDWLETYKKAKYKILNKENYLAFIT